MADYKERAKTRGLVAADKGDAARAMAGAARVIEAEFEFPYLAHAAMEPFAETGQYVNFLGAEHGPVTPEAARLAYGADKHQRLVELKNRYDPENLFRLNHNIVPVPA